MSTDSRVAGRNLLWEQAAGLICAILVAGGSLYAAELGFPLSSFLWVLRGFSILAGIIYAVLLPFSRIPLNLWLVGAVPYALFSDITGNWWSGRMISEGLLLVLLAYVSWGVAYVARRRVEPGS